MEATNFNKYSINPDNWDIETTIRYIERKEQTITEAQTELEIAWGHLRRLQESGRA